VSGNDTELCVLLMFAFIITILFCLMFSHTGDDE